MTITLIRTHITLFHSGFLFWPNFDETTKLLFQNKSEIPVKPINTLIARTFRIIKIIYNMTNFFIQNTWWLPALTIITWDECSGGADGAEACKYRGRTILADLIQALWYSDWIPVQVFFLRGFVLEGIRWARVKGQNPYGTMGVKEGKGCRVKHEKRCLQKIWPRFRKKGISRIIQDTCMASREAVIKFFYLKTGSWWQTLLTKSSKSYFVRWRWKRKGANSWNNEEEGWDDGRGVAGGDLGSHYPALIPTKSECVCNVGGGHVHGNVGGMTLWCYSSVSQPRAMGNFSAGSVCIGHC